MMGNDHEKQVRELVAPGWPAIEPRINEVFSWLEDPNCTGCWVALEFLKGVGVALLPHVRNVLANGTDDVRSALLGLVESWSREDVALLSVELEELVQRRDEWGNDLRALGLLVKHQLKDTDWLRRHVGNRISALESDLEELRRMQDSLDANPIV